jgi:hypothetical protein
VPHNLIPTQESPVSLLNFQIAPRLKIIVASGSKKGTRIYFSFSLKSPSKWTPSRFPNRAPMGRDACLQGILHISQKPHLLGSPVKEPSLKVPFMESLTERCPTTRALLHSSIKVPSIRAPPHTRFPSGSLVLLQPQELVQLSDSWFNPLNVQLNPICHLLALLGAHPILHVSRIRVKSCSGGTHRQQK